MSDENSLDSTFFGEMVITDWRLQRESPGAYRDAALKLLIRPPVHLQGETDTILFPLKDMESTKLVKYSASDQTYGTFVVQRRHMHKNCETCWIQNKKLDGVIDLTWSSRFVHTKRNFFIPKK